jgi:sterol desaturase/sphingolipid hydroxylase (fatty acid hydroxylase superfamily)
LPTICVAAAAGWLTYSGWHELADSGPLAAIRAGQAELAGPVVLGFVLAVFTIEQIWPAERRPLLALGHLLDLTYLLAYALLVVPFVVLIGTGFSSLIAHYAGWLMLPRLSAVPRVCIIGLAVLSLDAADWLAHLANHRITSLWRLHAVHHSQEEVSILTTYRAHPLVHVSFLISALPIFALAANDATPASILTVYACLGALPHANVRWSYGKVGRILVSPAYHRIHHSATGRLDINLGTVFTVWDLMSRRAVFPRSGSVIRTGLQGRPIPVEQSGPPARLISTFLIQWAEPFAAARTSVPTVPAGEVTDE